MDGATAGSVSCKRMPQWQQIRLCARKAAHQQTRQASPLVCASRLRTRRRQLLQVQAAVVPGHLLLLLLPTLRPPFLRVILAREAAAAGAGGPLSLIGLAALGAAAAGLQQVRGKEGG
jgi:hypothetical protein